MTRDFSYDFLRAFSAIMIVFCHVFQGFGISPEIGAYLGGTYVDVFLLLSAYLLGIRNKTTIGSNPYNFFRRRTNRLIPTYYIYFSIVLIIICGCIGSLSWKQIIGHYFFLNWFWQDARIYLSPFPQLGHLWFMSAILFAYLMVTVWGVIMRKNKWLDSNTGWVTFLVISILVSTVLTSKVRMMVYPCTASFFFILIFYKGEEIMTYIRRFNKIALVSLLVLFNSGGVLYYLTGGYEYPILVFWINIVNAFLWIACAPIVFNRKSAPKIVSFVSTISFEIYLIHHPFCLGDYSLKSVLPLWIAIPGVFIISISLGYILNLYTSRVNGFLIGHRLFKNAKS